jgi:two-component system, NtrC family, response regulator HydG
MNESLEGLRILVVDDSEGTREVLRRNLESAAYRVHTVESVTYALDALEDAPFDLVITDLRMPGASGLELVRHVRENLPDTEVIMVTGYASVEGAVEAVKMGADEYLSKPFTDRELLDAVSRSLTKLLQRRAGGDPGSSSLLARYGIVGTSAPMQRLAFQVERAARYPATALVTGESGTGKELVARAIHYHSARSSAPFVAVNCGGIPSGLIERELFGHKKGAYTGAGESRQGFFRTAQGGTILLDEIIEMELPMQVKLLRVLQEREFCMVGDTRTHKLDLRVIAATNKDLYSLVQRGRFREDLYYRLNVLNIDVPPLRERKGDIALLVRHFGAKYATEWGETMPSFSGKAIAAMERYDWPGNVRELENTFQRVVLMAAGDSIEVSDLPATMRYTAPKAAGSLRSLADVERDHIKRVLAALGGNKSKAAKVLGIDRKTLRSKLES